MDVLEFLRRCTGLEWDEHNAGKAWLKHHVSPSECEEAFFNRPLVVADDSKHSEAENRFYALCQTVGGRRLFIVFTVRRNVVRVVSARDMSRKERRAFHAHEEDPET